MKTSDFSYDLPPELIAAEPAERRDASRMLVVHRSGGRLEDRAFADFPSFLRRGDLLVVNDTRVLPARIFGRKPSGGQVEILLLEELRPGMWSVLLHASRRPKPGTRIALGNGQATAVMVEDGEKGRATIAIESDRPWMEVLEEIGEPPLPPYIVAARKNRPTPAFGHPSGGGDRERYQTVYARDPGAVAAPTAGLHFTPEVLTRLERDGVRRAAVTLHVGLGTFRPVDAENVEEHRMDAERYDVSVEVARLIEETKAAGGRVVAVGSTSVRTLESVAAKYGKVVPDSGRTDLFIYPPFQFRVVDAILTNFHLPQSTLLMMMSAFAGRDLILEAYREAVKERYRFYSYGDCMLIL